MTDPIEGVERQLRAAIDQAIAGGYVLTCGEWGVAYTPWRGFFPATDDRCGCALGAWALIRQPPVPDPYWPGDGLDRDGYVGLRIGAAVSADFGWSSSELRAFTDGWDGDVEPAIAEAHPEVVDLAQRLIEEYLLPTPRRRKGTC